MGNRRVLLDSVAKVENVRPRGEGGADALDRVAQRLTPGDQRQRVEIALHGKPRRKLGISPHRVDRLVEPDRIDPSQPRIGGELAPGASRRVMPAEGRDTALT